MFKISTHICGNKRVIFRILLSETKITHIYTNTHTHTYTESTKKLIKREERSCGTNHCLKWGLLPLNDIGKIAQEGRRKERR